MFSVSSANADVLIASLLKQHRGVSSHFTNNLRGRPTVGTFTISGLPMAAADEVLGETRGSSAIQCQFADQFEPYAVHLCRVVMHPGVDVKR